VTPGAIHLVSASAGSGKTYRLVDKLEKAITSDKDPVRPEAVIATTFTVKAAAELRERVRSRLLEAGHVEEAQRLGAARIGTVNSVCSQLVSDFAFELGLSPEVQVLDEPAANDAFRRALSSVVSVRGEDGDDDAATTASDAGAALMELTERWPGLNWLEDVRTIAAKARENRMSPAAIRAYGSRSAEGLLGCFGPAAKDGAALERALAKSVAAFVKGPLDETKKTAGVLAFVRQVDSRLRAGRPLPWCDWAKLVAQDPAVKSHDAYEPVRLAARGHERHPALRDELRRRVEAVFELAARAIEAYESYKREWGLMDFVDQEVKALQLLARQDVREMLREQVDLVLVDEFQDTSPLQLDIFLALSRIAPRTVWVGDQKQAIYGFRGTDPALMDAAIDAIVAESGEGAHESLPYSWRSRAELVRLTSDVFAPAFEAHGLPAGRVRLEPAPKIAERPDDMGPVVEAWLLATRNQADDAAAVAEATRQLLDDDGLRVRDDVTEEERRVVARDVAILCRSGDSCARVAGALEAAGIRAVRPRLGLMKTPEARLALAALRLWVEPRQALAAAEIGRLLTHPGAAGEWLNAVIDAPGTAYTDQAEVERIARARAALPLAGPLVAFDAAIEAAGLRETCLRWGRSAQRLANLDALRAFAHRYVANCGTEGEAATVAGLVAHLGSLADDEADEQATLSRENAVTVGTLHSAKGLEWPVTVLHAIDSGWKPSAFGVHVVSDREQFDFEDPLGGRWIRYWPDPYVPERRPAKWEGRTEMHERVRSGVEHRVAEQRQNRETLRLLYVGWTRARDRLVLTGRAGKVIGDTLGLLEDQQGLPLLCEPEAECVWAGRTVAVKIREVGPAEAVPGTPEAGFGYDAAGPHEFPPATRVVSSVAVTGTLGESEVLTAVPFVQLPVDWAALGSAVHAFFAGDRPGLDGRLDMAEELLARWGVQGSMRADALLAASSALSAWAARRWPHATWCREWPVRARETDGTELAGYADLVLMDEESFVLIDHKCLSGTREEALAGCAECAGQLAGYANVIARATGKRPGGCFIHLVTQGVVVECEGPKP
jgi:ATP-dependent helicase/nuclease subunit A